MAISYNDVKLFSAEDYNKRSADSLITTRQNNLQSTNALSAYVDSDGKTLKRAMKGSGLFLNQNAPDEDREFYSALNFFRANIDFFKNSKTVINLMNLFAWRTQEEYREVVTENYLYGKDTKEKMRDIKDVDIRKIASLFAENGDYKSKNAKLISNSEKLKELDENIAKLYEAWKYDILDDYIQAQK